jgi:hypothetical protein
MVPVAIRDARYFLASSCQRDESQKREQTDIGCGEEKPRASRGQFHSIVPTGASLNRGVFEAWEPQHSAGFAKQNRRPPLPDNVSFWLRGEVPAASE